MSKIFLYNADITSFKVQAIVNPANTSLLGGSGVDGAIHRKGGRVITDECIAIRAKQGGCAISEAVITSAGKLPADYVIHTVGPTWVNGDFNEKILLKNTYLSCLKMAEKYQIKELSFPNISTGRYKFPKEIAAKIAIETVLDFLNKSNMIQSICFLCYDKDNYEIYKRLLEVEKEVEGIEIVIN